MPIGLKDLYAAKGLPVTASSRVLEGNIADADCTAWARLRAAGMVLVGHLHTHEFACGGTTDQVGNPWRTDFTASGSSGGSGAAVAARMVPVATGTDTAGSIRAPASICGVSGIKPTTGRIPLGRRDPARTDVRHARAAGSQRRRLQCGAWRRWPAARRRPSHTPCPAGSLGELPLHRARGSQPLAGCTVAMTDRFAAFELDADVQAGYARALEAVQALGARLVELPAPVKAFTLDSPEFALVLVEMWAYHEQLFAGSGGAVPPAVPAHATRGTRRDAGIRVRAPSAAPRRVRRGLGELVRHATAST